MPTIGSPGAGLARFEQFRRAYDALALVQTMGLPASALIQLEFFEVETEVQLGPTPSARSDERQKKIT
jgi:hypothetical protein